MDENCLVLGCGYRFIRSPKTGLTFPAWLVQLPESDRQQWRSKRDFLVLGRASSKVIGSPLPKAALEKLSRRAPWKRPHVTVATDHHESTNLYDVSMKKSIRHLDQFLQRIHEYMLKSSVSDGELKEAWKQFCRKEDTKCLTTHSKGQHCEETAADERRSARLGQYFCTPENASQLVNTALQRIDLGSNRVVFLEPSCGHGDVVLTLVKELRRRSLRLDMLSIVACDIDAKAIQTCKEKILTTGSEERVDFRCCDFLSTKPTDFGVAENDVVVCLGGPPYTSGAGSGANTKRDLCQLFLFHAIHEWRASVVAFLLPKRYAAKPLKLQQTDNDRGTVWVCETQDLSSSAFLFRGITKVIQPSILQCWYREDEART